MESTKQSKLVIKAFSEEIASKLRKILKKIEEKYAANNIKIYEITLCLEVSDPNKARSILSNFKEKYEFFRNTIRFQYFRDSLKAFLLLESEMEVRFMQTNWFSTSSIGPYNDDIKTQMEVGNYQEPFGKFMTYSCIFDSI